MDQDDFNDFESAPAQEAPKTVKIDELTLSVHSQPAEVPHNSPDLLKDLSLQPSFSQITNPPSEGRREIDNNDWYNTSQPSLVKMESEVLFGMEPNGLSFSKSHSQTDFQSKGSEIHFDYLSLGDFKVSQQKPASEANIPVQLLTSQLQNEIKVPQQGNEHFHFDSLPSKNQAININIQSQSSAANQGLFWEAEIQQDKPETQIIVEDVIKDDARKESQQFVFQQEEHKKQQQSTRPPVQQLVAHQRVEEEDSWNFKASVDHTIKQQETDPRKESEQLVFQEIKQPSIDQKQLIVDKGNQPRKESDDFVFQTATQFNQGQQPLSSAIEAQPLQNIGIDLNSQIQVSHKQRSTTEVVLNGIVQLQANIQQEQLKIVEDDKQQEDDEFGQFEETVEAIQPSIPVNTYQIQEQNNQMQGKVQIIAEKAPYDMNVLSRAQELQAFVNSLPNYSFILAEAFNSI